MVEHGLDGGLNLVHVCFVDVSLDLAHRKIVQAHMGFRADKGVGVNGF